MEPESQEEFTDDNASNAEGEFQEDEDNSENGHDQEDENEEYDLGAMKNHAGSLQKFHNIAENLPIEVFNDIQKTIKLIAQDSTEDTMKAVEVLLADYEKLKAVFEESKNQTVELAKKATEMSEEIVDNNQKMQKLVKGLTDEKSNGAYLKKELKKAWAVVESNTEKDAKTKELVLELKEELTALKGTDMHVAGGGSSPGKGKLLAMQAEQEEEIRTLSMVLIY
jgi:hypothetical protein